MADKDISDLPVPGKSSVPDISDLPTPSGMEGSVMAPQKDKGLFEKVKEVGKGAAAGTAMGAVWPEILTGAGMLASGVYPPAAPFLLAGGQLARGGRLASAVTGGISGAGAEIAGQFVPGGEKVLLDIPGRPVTRKEAAELAGGFVTPGVGPAAGAVTKMSYGVRNLFEAAKKMAGGESQFTRAATNELANFRNRYPVNQLLNTERLRSNPQDAQNYQTVFDAITKADAKVQSEVTQNITQAQSQADQIMREATARANQAVTTRKGEAQRILDEGNAKAKQILDNSIEEAKKKLGIIGRARAAGQTAAEAPQNTLRAIGDPSTTSATSGGNLQQRVVGVLSAEQKALNDAYQNERRAVDTLVAQQEGQGIGINRTAGYKELSDFLDRQLLKGEVGEKAKFAPVTESQLKNTLANIRKAVRDQQIFEGIDEAGTPIYRDVPSSFAALDHVRRKLGEVFKGEAPEGFKGLLKDQAVELYKMVRKAQVEYAGGEGGAFDNLLKNYAEGKEILDALKIPAGKRIAKKDLINPEYLVYDPSRLPGEFFTTRKNVQDLVNLTRDAGFVEQQASNHVARTLKDADAKTAKTYLDKNSEWLDLFPQLRAKVEAHVNALARSERVVPRTETLAKALKTEWKAIPGVAQKEADQAVKDAAKAAKDVEQQGKKDAAQIMREAEKKRREIEGASRKLMAAGITGNPVTAIETIINRGNETKLAQIAPIIKSDPEVHQAFISALETTLSRAKPETIFDNWERVMKPALLRTELVTPAKAEEISKRIRIVQMTLEPSAIAQTARWIIRTSLTTGAAMAATE